MFTSFFLMNGNPATVISKNFREKKLPHSDSTNLTQSTYIQILKHYKTENVSITLNGRFGNVTKFDEYYVWYVEN